MPISCGVCLRLLLLFSVYITASMYIHGLKIVTSHYLSANCSYGDVRLRIDQDPTPYELIENELARGRVEVCIDEKFGTVCDEFWNHTDASVVCQQLGFSPYGKMCHIVFQYHLQIDTYASPSYSICTVQIIVYYNEH